MRTFHSAMLGDRLTRHSVLPIEKITITIECGNDLDTQFHIPLGLLCTQSQKQLEIFCQTEDLRNRYAKVKALRKRVNAVHPLLELHAIKHTERCREKVWHTGRSVSC